MAKITQTAWDEMMTVLMRTRLENERLRAALEVMLEQAEGCWLNHYGENPDGSPIPPHIKQARMLLSEKRAGES